MNSPNSDFADCAQQPPWMQHLNPEQRAAVTLPAGHALILAGAGSGKTRVLTTRIAWLLHQGLATPASIMAVTFTNKAAQEMTTRLGAMLPWDTRAMWMGTFHGLAHRLLRRHHQLAALPQGFQILDTQDQLAAIKRLAKELGIDDQDLPPKELQWFIAGCKDEGLRARDVPAANLAERKKRDFYERYEQQCAREGVVDFGELILRSYELLVQNADLRQHYQRRFTHILVDEFQDTSRLQYLWLQQFVGQFEYAQNAPNPQNPAQARAHETPFGAEVGAKAGGASVLVVGDDDQSIYAFRGARVDNMADFVRQFHVAPHHQIKLERNYRSSGHILDAANALIAHNPARMGKTLQATQDAGEPLRVQHCDSDMLEAQWLTEEIAALASDGVSPRDIAILYRSNAQSRVIEGRLFNAGIAYRVWGGLRFFERAEVKHALAYLRLVENPGDDTSFLRVINFPARGIGTRTLETLQEAARARSQSLWQACAHMPGASGARLNSFVALIDHMRRTARGLSLSQTIAMVLDTSGLIAHYEREKDGSERLENLRELINAAQSFVIQEGFGLDAAARTVDASAALVVDEAPTPHAPAPKARASRRAAAAAAAHDHAQASLLDLFDAPPSATQTAPVLAQSPSSTNADLGRGSPAAATNAAAAGTDAETGETLSPLQAFLAHAALEAGDHQASAAQDAVQLMTIHAAKGLEFDAVFITGLEQGLFPHERSVREGGSSDDNPALQEERRLMYVAITRARKRLYLSWAHSRMLNGRTIWTAPSRFIEELPAEALKWLTPPPLGSAHASASAYTPSREKPAWGRGWDDAPAAAMPSKTLQRQNPDTGAVLRRPAVKLASSATGPERSDGIARGVRVFHTKFGQGQVLAIEGVGEQAKAQVHFTRHGTKWLALSVAKLTVIDE